MLLYAHIIYTCIVAECVIQSYMAVLSKHWYLDGSVKMIDYCNIVSYYKYKQCNIPDVNMTCLLCVLIHT